MSVRWLRVLIAGFLAEVALIAVAVPLYFLPDRTTALDIGVPPVSFLVLIPFGWWAARGAPRAQVLNGFLAGLAGVVLYLCLTGIAAVVADRDLSASFRPAYLLAHALKLAGGALGGWLAARKRALAHNPA
jgi:putative membrane protein (TIGR04086 family)